MKYPVEICLVLSCLRVSGGDQQREEIQRLAGKIKDWHELIRLCVYHKVLPLVFQTLEANCQDQIPSGILEKFKQFHRNNEIRNTALSGRLLGILKLFQANRIQAVAFKGAAISQRAYGDINARMFEDLDILISQADVKAAKKLLTENGFSAEIHLPPQKEKHYLDHENSISFSDQTRLYIDLHWEMTGRYLLKPIYLEHLSPHLEETVFFDKKILLIPDHLMLVYLGVHGTSHCWERLEWLVCFTRLAQKQSPENISLAFDFARDFGAMTMMATAFLLSERLLALPVPEEIETHFQKNKKRISKALDKIQHRVFQQMVHPPGDAPWHFSSLHLLVRDSLKDRAAYSIHLLTMPTIKEWTRYPLPAFLLPLYRFLRPLRLLMVYLFGKNPLSNSVIPQFLHRLKKAVKEENKGGKTLSLRSLLSLFFVLTRKSGQMLTDGINRHFYNRNINSKKINQLHRMHPEKQTNHFYVIGMPGKLGFLEICLDLIPKNTRLFVLLNGVSKTDFQKLKEKYPHFPMAALECFPFSRISHGDIITLLLEINQNNFGLIDHDLYIYNPEIFNNLIFETDEYIIGAFPILNERSGIVFPATYFLFFNLAIIKKIMRKYHVEARIYSRIPRKIIPRLERIHIGYDNFLKDYLHYFDPLNLIFALAEYEGYKPKFITTKPGEMIHFGEKVTDDLAKDKSVIMSTLESLRLKSISGQQK